MTYIQVAWIHSLNSEPILLYSEIDEGRWETRKVEVYADGRIGFASSSESKGGSGLGTVPLPLIAEIAADPQFELVEIDQADFEKIWAKARG
jgi:hypothetical protein